MGELFGDDEAWDDCIREILADMDCG